MNKKLVAVAVAGVLASPLAAEAQTANVTLYGRLNGDIEVVNGQQTTAACTAAGLQPNCNPWVTRVSSNSSRIGVRGTESLGGGLNAIFQIESGLTFDTGIASGTSGTGSLGSRETFVGLQGSWGKAYIGNFLAPVDDLHGIFGNVPTFLTSILSTANLWAQGTLTKGQGGFDARLANSVRYDSPSWNGLTFSGQVALADNSGVTSSAADGGNTGNTSQTLRHAYVISVNTLYNNGPWQAGVGYEENVKYRCINCSDYFVTAALAYNFGIVRLAAVYSGTRYQIGGVNGYEVGDLKSNLWGVSVTAPVGPGVLYGFYGLPQHGRGSAPAGSRVGGMAIGDNTKSQQPEISYTYPFSKRTSVYAGWTKLVNQSNASYTFNINAYPTAIGGKPQGFVFGIIHLF